MAIVAALFPLAQAIPAFAADSVIVINEVELNPPGTDGGAEKVELYNPSDSAVDVGGWTISSTGETGAIVTIPDGMKISAKDHVLVDRGAQWLGDSGETIILMDGGRAVIDKAGPFSDDEDSARTWQRSPDGAATWIFASGTLGGSNAGTGEIEIPGPAPSAPEQPTEPGPLPPLDLGGQGPQPGANQKLKIVFIDVGQGDSALVILPNGKTMLIDGGDRDQGQTVLSTLRDQNVSRVDVMVATHPHADHIGGLIEVINSIDVGYVLDSGQVHATQTFEDLLDAIESSQTTLVSTADGAAIPLDPAVQIDVLNPPTLLDGADDEERFNDNSVVIKLTYGEFTVLFTGDMTQTNEARLYASSRGELESDVLKAGHHGSRTSSTSEFLDAVNPQVVVISAGANNDYGHPHQEALNRMKTAGIEHVLRTDIDGSITLAATSDGNYNIETSRSNKTVVVPEFETAILVAGISLISIVAYASRGRIWKLSGLA